MIVLRTLKQLHQYVAGKKQIGKQIGFVPTMGFLHAGHVSLIHLCNHQADITIASIYVNPSQFNDSNDFHKYPKDETKDLKLLKANFCDAVLIPTQAEIEKIKKVSVDLGQLDKVMEGKFRPNHFQGVIEIVYRLFSVVLPDKAFFGEKDFQQLQVIKRMVEKLKLPVEIISAPILREENGLAMSSRNSRLSPKARDSAGFIFKALKCFNKSDRRLLEEQLFESGFELDYLEVHQFGNEKRLFIAGMYDGVRLIDNIKLN